MYSKKRISIIIVNYNLAEEIENCLDSFFNVVDLTGDMKFEIIIVDNNSPDKKLPLVEKKYANSIVSFYYLPENIGFGKGCNYGFSKASGDYICFLNPDTLVKENIFETIIRKFEDDGSVGIIAPRQQVKSNCFDFSAGFYPNVFFELFNLFGAGVFLEGFLVFVLTKLKNNRPIHVDWILGAAIFIRTELFKEVGGFDKDYFMFFEEVDLCKKVTEKGYKVLYCPGIKIHHIGSVSGKKDYKLYTIRTYSSKYIYLSKHYKSFNKYIMKSLLFVQLFSQIIIWTILLPRNKDKSKQKISAFWYLIKNNIQMV